MMTVYRWSPGQPTVGPLGAADFRALLTELESSSDVLWIDLDDPTPEEEDLALGGFFPVHPLTREDITRLRREPNAPPHFPKVEEFARYLFVVVNPLRAGYLDDLRAGSTVVRRRATTQLSAVLAERILVTHHYEPVEGVEGLRAFLARHEGRADRGPDYLFHLILDAMVDEYAPVLDVIDDTLEGIEADVLARPSQAQLLRLLSLKREIIHVRKTLVYEREVLARLIRGELALIDEAEVTYYRNVYDHLVRFAELAESSREMASDLMQTHLSAVSNRLSEVMKALTMISTVVLPMTLVAGVFGMNVEGLPGAKSPWGFALSLGLMAVAAVASFLFFRWKRWL